MSCTTAEYCLTQTQTKMTPEEYAVFLVNHFCNIIEESTGNKKENAMCLVFWEAAKNCSIACIEQKQMMIKNAALNAKLDVYLPFRFYFKKKHRNSRNWKLDDMNLWLREAIDAVKSIDTPKSNADSNTSAP
jgi:hypothetical protein